MTSRHFYDEAFDMWLEAGILPAGRRGGAQAFAGAAKRECLVLEISYPSQSADGVLTEPSIPLNR